MAQQGPIKITAEFPGFWLKWVHVAEPVFQREHLSLENYNIAVIDRGESVVVMLEGLNASRSSRGSTSGVPGYEVEISKKDMKVLRSNYSR